MEELEFMNIFSALFGIFRKRGLVSTIKEGKSLIGFAIFAVIISIIGSLLYGFAMGIGLGMDTAIKDAIKLGLIVVMVLLFSLPVFWVAYRLLGREENMGQVAAVPLTLVSSVSIILAVTAPVVFLLSLLIGFTSDAIYIHVVIVDIAILVGLYLGAVLIANSFKDQSRLVVPNVIGFLMMAVILIVLMSFFGPFLRPYATFSVGTDLLIERLGVGLEEKVIQSLAAAGTTERTSYRFKTTNPNGDIQQEYSIFRSGEDYLIEIHLHSVLGEPIVENKNIWILDGITYTNIEGGYVNTADRAGLSNFLENALPPAVFAIPSEFNVVSWRALDTEGVYTVTGSASDLQQVILKMNSAGGRLTEFKIGSSEPGTNPEKRVWNINASEVNRADIEEILTKAIASGSVIGVSEKVEQSLAAAITAERVNYRFQTTNENGDLVRDYTVTRIGDDYLIEVHLHAAPGETFQQDKNIWVLDNITYTDFNEGIVLQEDPANLSSFLELGLPSEVFSLPTEFETAAWSAFERGSRYTAAGATQSLSEVILVMDAITGRLSDLTLRRVGSELHAELRVKDISVAELDRAGLEANLNQAIVVGSVDRLDASMQDYIQGQVFFVARYPRNWSAGTWSLSKQSIEFTADCISTKDCASLKVNVFDLAADKGPKQYAEDLAASLGLQPEYRDVTSGTVNIAGQTVGVVEYLFDQVESGEIKTNRHIEYIFEGQLSRYHLDFSMPDNDFESFRNLFAAMAELFTYLRE